MTPDHTPRRGSRSRSSSRNSIGSPEPDDWQLVAETLANDRISISNGHGLQPNDIVCGRGAPTNFHGGNQSFRELVKDHETAYLCAKRSDKPLIAMKVLHMIQSRGGRFVRRIKTAGDCSSWVEIGEKAAYEKVCQALRDGAPDVRKQMIASSSCTSSAVKSKVRKAMSGSNSVKENSVPNRW